MVLKNLDIKEYNHPNYEICNRIQEALKLEIRKKARDIVTILGLPYEDCSNKPNWWERGHKYEDKLLKITSGRNSEISENPFAEQTTISIPIIGKKQFLLWNIPSLYYKEVYKEIATYLEEEKENERIKIFREDEKWIRHFFRLDSIAESIHMSGAQKNKAECLKYFYDSIENFGLGA